MWSKRGILKVSEGQIPSLFLVDFFAPVKNLNFLISYPDFGSGFLVALLAFLPQSLAHPPCQLVIFA